MIVPDIRSRQDDRPLPHLALLTLDFAPDPGGVQEYLYEVSQRLAQAYQVTVLTPTKGALPGGAQMERVLVNDAGLASFWRQLRTLRPSRIVVGHAHPRLMAAAALAGRYATIAYGNDFLAAQYRWHRPLFNFLLRRSAPLITISQASAIQLQRIGIGAAFLVKPGANMERFAPRRSESVETPPTLLTVSRLVPRKGIDTVLHALPQLLADFPNVRYQVAGDGPDRERLEQITDTLGIRSVVRFLGRVPPDELPALYNEAHIFIMLSREDIAAASMEGFGIVFLEASASGLPVIAGRSGGSAEAVLDGETGLLIEPDNPGLAAKALSELLGDAARARRMGMRGRQWVEEEMNWERAGEEMLRLLVMNSEEPDRAGDFAQQADGK